MSDVGKAVFLSYSAQDAKAALCDWCQGTGES